MAVRNWWIEVEIDGRKTKLCGGPQSKDGGFTLKIHQRDKGGIIPDVLSISGDAANDGSLHLAAYGDNTTGPVFVRRTTR